MTSKSSAKLYFELYSAIEIHPIRSINFYIISRTTKSLSKHLNVEL